MTKTNLKVVPLRTPERQALAEVIAQRAGAEKELAEVHAGIVRADEQIAEQRQILTEAAASAEQAEGEERERLKAQLLGHSSGSARSDADGVVNVMGRVTKKIAVLEDVKRELTDRRSEISNHLDMSRWRLDSAMSAVAKADPAVLALLEEMETATRRYETLLITMRFLSAKNLLPTELKSWGNLDRTRLNNGLPADAPWRAAIARLMTDPDATLPGPMLEEPFEARNLTTQAGAVGHWS